MVQLKKKIVKEINISFEEKTQSLLDSTQTMNYFQIYLEIFISKLKNNRFKCVGYDLIHIIASEDFNNEIREKNTAIEKFGSAKFSYDNYIK